MKLSIIYMLDNRDYQKSLKIVSKKQYTGVEIILVNRILKGEEFSNFKKNIKSSITVLDCYHQSLKECLENAWPKIQGEFVYVTTSSCNMSANAISSILKKINEGKADILYIRDSLFYSKTKKLEIPFHEKDIVSTNFYAYVFRKNLVNSFDDVVDICDSETCIQILLRLFSQKDEITYIKNAYLLFMNTLSFNHDCHNKNWYTYTIQNIYLPYASQHDLSFLEEGILYESIFEKFKMNKNGANKEVLLGEERYEFFQAIGKLLQQFKGDFFDSLDRLDQSINSGYAFKYLMILFREGVKNYSVKWDGENILSTLNSHDIPLQNVTFNIESLNYHDHQLTIDATFNYVQMAELSSSSIYALVDGKRVDVKKLEIYSLTKYFAVSMQKKFVFQLTVPFNGIKSEIQFVFSLNGEERVVPLNFHKVASRLTNIYPHSYWQYKDILVKYQKNKIIMTKNKAFRHLTSEFAFYWDLMIYSKGLYRIKNLFLRTLYWLLKPFYAHKRIWLYFDKLYKADDNGEFAITYTSKLQDGINHYYVINKDSYDLPRLKNKGIKIIKFNTLRHKLMSLYAENIVATHPDIIKFCGFGKNLQLSFRNLFNANIICIAHGLTMQKNAEVQNRLYDNTMFYTTSSKYEVEHLLKPAYGYTKDQIALTGMARFDVMIPNDQREILITPTWRRSISGVSNFNSPKEYNDEFKSSSYYKIYNSLINDKDLIQCAKENGYRIIFLLHPAMSSQINDYDKNEYVTFLQATSDISYHDILSKSSLMVTDYSGVQYDFAYMHKPIIYYHSELLPPRFEEGALKYDTMGFGPICLTHESVVSELIKYMKNDCKIEKKYDDRINDFFAFDDRNNSQRIYEAILEFTERMKK